MHHPTRTTAMLGANATTRMPKEPPTQPMTIHGRRMPSCDEVRSLILPKIGLPTIDSNAPMEATSAKLCGAWLIPTRAFTFNARVTSRRSEEHTSELQSRENLVCRLLLEKKKTTVQRRAGL